METIIILGVEIQYNLEDVRILDSYLIEDKGEMRDVLKEFLEMTGYESKRSMESWVREWDAHNELYKRGLWEERTRDCDLEEDENIWKLIGYKLIEAIKKAKAAIIIGIGVL